MNRPSIDLCTKQSLIMCERAFNWGRETRSLQAKPMPAGELVAFDWALFYWGKGSDTRHHSASASGFFLLSLFFPVFCNSTPQPVSFVTFCFQISMKVPWTFSCSTLLYLSSVVHSLTHVFDFWTSTNGSGGGSASSKRRYGRKAHCFARAVHVCVLTHRRLWTPLVLVSQHQQTPTKNIHFYSQ